MQLYPKFFGKFNYPFEFQNQTQFTNNPNLKQFGSNFSFRNSKINIDDAAVITDFIFQWPKEFNAFISLKTLPNIFDFKSLKFQTQKYFWNNTILSSKPLETTFKPKGILIFPKIPNSQSIKFIFKHYSGIFILLYFKYSLEFYFKL